MASPTSKELEGTHHAMWFKVLLDDNSWRLLYLTKNTNFRTKWNQIHTHTQSGFCVNSTQEQKPPSTADPIIWTITKLNWFYHFAMLPVFADRRDCQVNSYPSVWYTRMLLLRIHWLPTVCDYATEKLTSKCNLLIQWHLTVQSLYFCVLIICLYIQPESGYKPQVRKSPFSFRENLVILSQKLWHTSTKRGND